MHAADRALNHVAAARHIAGEQRSSGHRRFEQWAVRALALGAQENRMRVRRTHIIGGAHISKQILCKLRVDFGTNAPDRSQFWAKDAVPPAPVIVGRLFSKTIADKLEPAFPCVPQQEDAHRVTAAKVISDAAHVGSVVPAVARGLASPEAQRKRQERQRPAMISSISRIRSR